MRRDFASIVWGFALIAAGALFLAINAGWMDEPDEQTWMLLLAAFGALILVAYLVGPKERWGLLFPAIGALIGAGAVWLEEGEAAGNEIGAAVILVMSVPFWVGFAASRGRERWTLIPGWSMAAVAFLILFENSIPGDLFATLILLAIALPFLAVFLFERSNWWALIPAGVLSFSSLMVLLGERWQPQFIGAGVLWIIAAAFYAVFLARRESWWALIPAWALTVIGAVVVLSAYWVGALIGTIMLWGVAIPFAVVYTTNRERWWALIPAGVLTTLGLVAAFAEAAWVNSLSEASVVRLLGGTFTAGLALTFAIVWLQRNDETRWAIFPAAVLGGLTLLLVLLGLNLQLVWSLALIGLGIWLLFNSGRLRPKA